MKKALPLAALSLIVAGFFVHSRLEAEVGELRRTQAEHLVRMTQLQRNINQLRVELAQAQPAQQAVTAPQPAAPDRTPTGPAAPVSQSDSHRLLEAQVEQVRGLKFLQPIVYRTIPSKDLRGFLARKVREEYTPAELRDYSRGLAMVGLLPDGVDFEATVMEVLGEQVAAFYDQDSAQLYTFSDSSLTGNMDRTILAHEMTHALQDQHFHIKNWPLKRKDNDDLVSASLAVLEGDATVTMQKVFLLSLDWKTALSDLLAAMKQRTDKIEHAPRYFREMLLFPYQEGQAFIARLAADGGTAGVNRAFQQPPTTTAQVLHPEKFFPNREEPVPVEPAASTRPGWRRLTRNVVGEFGVIVLLREFGHAADAAEIAAGWRGDRYVAFDTGDGAGKLFWRSQWRSPAAAQRFAAAYRDVVIKRNAGRAQPLVLETLVVDCVVDLALRVPVARLSAPIPLPAAGAGHSSNTSTPTSVPGTR